MFRGSKKRHQNVFVVNFKHISHFVLVFLLLTLNMELSAGSVLRKITALVVTYPEIWRSYTVVNRGLRGWITQETQKDIIVIFEEQFSVLNISRYTFPMCTSLMCSGYLLYLLQKNVINKLLSITRFYKQHQAEIGKKIKETLSNTLRLNLSYLKIIHILHPRCHLKMIRYILKNV